VVLADTSRRCTTPRPVIRADLKALAPKASVVPVAALVVAAVAIMQVLVDLAAPAAADIMAPSMTVRKLSNQKLSGRAVPGCGLG
jgi:hypothetical protein